ncbi:MAG: hypothetical protein HRU19_23345 [Pseudobacteriovorax sp.]|nr:hypothetical protein [Pseudobacteriovorax sp.]
MSPNLMIMIITSVLGSVLFPAELKSQFQPPNQVLLPNILSNQYQQNTTSNPFGRLGDLDGAIHATAFQPDGFNFELMTRVNLHQSSQYFETLKVGVTPKFVGETGRGRLILFTTKSIPAGSSGWRRLSLPARFGGEILGHFYVLDSNVRVERGRPLIELNSKLKEAYAQPGHWILFENFGVEPDNRERFTWILTLKAPDQTFRVPFAQSMEFYNRGGESKCKSFRR